MPLIWMFIDEAHEFLPLNKKTIATDALVQLLREGRQPGISMILATQQPGKIHRDVMTQSDVVLSHKVTSAQDLSALNSIMQSYMLESISQYMNELPNLKRFSNNSRRHFRKNLSNENSPKIYLARRRGSNQR